MSYYKILGISETANAAEIKKAFRRKSLLYHPDKSYSGNENNFKEITDAYSILSNLDKRAKYDAALVKEKVLQKEPKNDIAFPTYESNKQVYQPEYMVQKAKILEDISRSIEIDFEEAYKGTCKTISISRKINDYYETDNIFVEIPEGVINGEIFIIKEKGNIIGDRISDVRVKVEIKEKDNWRRDGLNVYRKISISLKEALCGFKKEIEMLDGSKSLLSIDNGKVINPKTIYRLPSKGFKRNDKTGHMFIEFEIDFPDSLEIDHRRILSKILV